MTADTLCTHWADRPVAHHEVPAWLHARLVEVVPPALRDELAQVAPSTLLVRAAQQWAKYSPWWHWLDHWGTAASLRAEQPVLVAEPYGLHTHNIHSLIEFCALVRCHFEVDPKSAHVPGETIRIWIYPIEPLTMLAKCRGCDGAWRHGRADSDPKPDGPDAPGPASQ